MPVAPIQDSSELPQIFHHNLFGDHIPILSINIEEVRLVDALDAVADAFPRNNGAETMTHSVEHRCSDAATCRTSYDNAGVHADRMQIRRQICAEKSGWILLDQERIPLMRRHLIADLHHWVVLSPSSYRRNLLREDPSVGPVREDDLGVYNWNVLLPSQSQQRHRGCDSVNNSEAFSRTVELAAVSGVSFAEVDYDQRRLPAKA